MKITVTHADGTTYDITEGVQVAYDAVPKDAGARAKREALDDIRRAIRHAEGNLSFASQSLNEHAENVVQKARADIEAMVQAESARLALPAGESTHLLELPAFPGEGVEDSRGRRFPQDRTLDSN